MSGFRRVVWGPFLVLALVAAGFAVSTTAASAADGSVVINEIMYKPAGLDGTAEFIELYNPGDTNVNLTGYTIEDDAGLNGTLSGVLLAKGYVLITNAAFTAASTTWPGITLVGTFTNGLSGSADTIIIKDAGGIVVDELTYTDDPPWPSAPDEGDGASLELIDAATNNVDGANWAGTATINTPGIENSVTTTPPPTPITNVVATPFSPTTNQDITVVATVPQGGAAPTLFWREDFASEAALTMRDNGIAPDVTANDGIFTVTIPDQSSGSLVRYRIVSSGGLEYPTGDGRNYDGVVVTDPGEIPTNLVKMEWFIPEVDYDAMFGDPTDRTVSIDGSVLAIDGVVYDNMTVKIRGGDNQRLNHDKQGLSFDMPDGVLLDNMTAYPVDEFALTSERGWTFGRVKAAWELYSAAGFPEVAHQPVRLQLNGSFDGIYRFSEKLDGTWRDNADIDGDFYKAVIPGFVDPSTGFEKKQLDEDLQPVIDFANAIKGPDNAAKTAYIYDNIDIPNAVNYHAAATIVGHFDSRVQNFYLHEDGTTGLWEIYPWDLTNTFGVNGPTCPNPDVLNLDCVDSELYEALLEVPGFEEMMWRRVRTIIDGPFANGELEAIVQPYIALVSSAEKQADDAKWNSVASYNSFATVNSEMDLRRNGLLGLSDVPASQPLVPGVVITEIVHSGASGPDWLELHNPTSASVDLSGWTLDGVDLVVPGGTVLLPGEYLVVTRSIAEFQAEYPNSVNAVLVQMDGGLSGNGELLELKTATGAIVDSVDYNSDPSWPIEPTTGLVSLSLFNPTTNNALSSAWGISATAGGTPGTANNTVAGQTETLPNIVINEIHYNPATGDGEFVELYNAGTTAVDLEGFDLDGMITFPAGTTIPPQGYLVVTRSLIDFQAAHPGVAALEWTAGETLSNSDENVSLKTALGNEVDAVEYFDIAPWPTEPDGNGPSLELIDPALDNSLASSWRASFTNGGSPVASNSPDCATLTFTVDIGAGDSPTAGDDIILGTNSADLIVASTGNDIICGQGGDDIINAGPGNDWVDAGSGNDTVFGLDGNDTLNGGIGNDEIIAGIGNDILDGGPAGDDVLNGGPGNDVLNGLAGNDDLFGQGGDDILNGGNGDDLLVGVDGIDILNGGGGTDVLNGGSGDDMLNGNAGNDTLFGLAGNDTLNGGNDDDLVFGQTGADTLNGGLGNDQLWGNEANDTITDPSGTNTINGGPGNDNITGGTGNDTIFGDGNLTQAGNDTITGGPGNDLLIGFAGQDTINANDGEVDVVNGGPGTNTCTTDNTDTVYNC